MNREQWLTDVAKLMEPIFIRQAFPIRGKYRLTCGWPCKQATSLKQRRIGECHPISRSKDGVSEVFISPTLDEPLSVAGVICHELIHVAVGTEEGHKGKFRVACRYLGMAGKLTQATPGQKLNDEIRRLIEPVGIYPHSALTVPAKLVSRSNSIKLECPKCDCVLRITDKWLTDAGVPTCGCGSKFNIPE